MRRWLPIPLLLAASVLLVSCSEDFAPLPDMDIDVGVVHGTVTVAGEPASLEIRAELRDPPGHSARVTTRSDSTGAYRLELPFGEYKIYAEIADGYTSCYESEGPTVLEVGPLPRRRDLELGRVRGELRLPEGWEGARIRVALNNEVWTYQPDFTEVVDGVLAFDIPGVHPGRYTIRMEPSVYEWMETGVPLSPSQPDSVEIQVPAGTAVRDFDFRATACNLSGTVSGPWAEVSASSIRMEVLTPTNHRLLTVPLAEDGAWSAEVLLAQTLVLRALLPGGRRFLGGRDLDLATRFEPTAGESLTGLDMEVGGFVIRFEEPYGSLPDVRFDLDVYDEAGAEVLSTWTSNGSITVLSLEPGDYRLLVSGDCVDDPWIPVWYGSDGSAAGAEAVTVTDGGWISLEVPFLTGARMSGRLAWSDGLPLSYGRVELVPEQASSPCGGSYVRTDFGGRFDLRGIPDGRYRLVAYQGYWTQPWWYPGTGVTDQAAWITVEDGLDLGALDWVLPAAMREEP